MIAYLFHVIDTTSFLDRASIEPNFHDLYLKFLDKVNSRPLNKDIEKATYENCKVFLQVVLVTFICFFVIFVNCSLFIIYLFSGSVKIRAYKI